MLPGVLIHIGNCVHPLRPEVPITDDLTDLTRTAMFMPVVRVFHALGLLHAFLDPGYLNGYSYHYVRLYSRVSVSLLRRG